MRHGQALTSLLVLVAGTLVIGAGVHTARGGLATAATAPRDDLSTEPTSTAAPASDGVVRRALRGRRAAVHGWREWNRARSCLSIRVVQFAAHSARRPHRAEPDARWVAAARGWRLDRDEYRARTDRLVCRMKSPGGGGAARWWPAALYAGWEPSLKSWFCYVVWRESSARPLAVNASSGCFGLLQLHPMFWAKKGLAWIRDPLNQLRMGWRLYRECGAQPWAL